MATMDKSVDTDVAVIDPNLAPEPQERRPVQDSLHDLLSKVVDQGSVTDCVAQHADIVPELQRLLTLWKESKGRSTPRIIICLLDHTYPSSSSRIPTLEGVDAHKFALLQALATPLGFYLGLASFTGKKWERIRDREPSWGDINWHDSFDNFLDLDGNRVPYILSVEKDATIPPDFHSAIDEGSFVKETYMELGGDEKGLRKRDYRRTVLVIWPGWSNFDIRYPGRKGFERALSEVKTMASRKRKSANTTSTMKLVDELLEHSHRGVRRVAGVICDLAYHVGNPELWNRTIISCDVYGQSESTFWYYSPSDGDDSDCSRYSHSTELGFKNKDDIRFEDEYYEVSGEGYYNSMYNTERVIPTYKIVAAVQKFGFQVILPGLEHMLGKDSCDASKLMFLEHLEKRCVGGPNGALPEWCAAQKLKMFMSLKEATKLDIRLFFAVAKTHGGIEYLKDHMLARIVSVTDENVPLEFASELAGGTTFPPCDARATVVAELVKAAISKEPFYKYPPPRPLNRGVKPHDVADMAEHNRFHVTFFVDKILQLECGYMLPNVLERIVQVNEALEGIHAVMHAAYVMLPLVVYVANIHPRYAPVLSNFAMFQEKTVYLVLDQLQESFNDDLLLKQLTTLVDAALTRRDGELFIRTVWPRIRRLNLPQKHNQNLLDHIVSNSERIVTSVPDEKWDAFLRSETAILSRYCAQIHTVPSIVAALDFASKAHDPTAAIEDSITGALSPTILNAAYVESVLGPLIPKLQEWAVKHQTNLDCFVRKIIVVCIEQLLGPMPVATPTLSTQLSKLAQWVCSCASCQAARSFLAHSEGRTTKFRIMGGPRVEKHVLEGLTLYATDLATWDVSHDRKIWLSITKSDALHELIRWRMHRTKGAALVRSIGRSEDDVQRILGSDYERVAAIVYTGSGLEKALDRIVASPQPQLEVWGTRTANSMYNRGFASQWQSTHRPAAKKRRY